MSFDHFTPSTTADRKATRRPIETTHEVGVNDLARRVLTFSSSSPEALGDNVEAMLADVKARLVPFSRDGLVVEALVSVAQIVRR